MKKNFLVLAMLVAMAALFAGCGGLANPFAPAPSDTKDKDTADESDADEDEDEDEDEEDDEDEDSEDSGTHEEDDEDSDVSDVEDVEDVMDSYADYGAQYALDEFNNTEAVDPPEYFPTSLIYPDGKITSSSDYGDESYISKDITIETTDDLKTIKAFYKDLFSQTTWHLVSQSNESDGASYDATDSAAIDASVYIYADPYSKIISISVTYSGYITE